MSSDREFLNKLLGMLGSAHEGERASAALKISDIAKRRGLTIVRLIETEFKAMPAFMQDRPSQAEIVEQLHGLKDVPHTEWRARDWLIGKETPWTEREVRRAEELIRVYGAKLDAE